MQGREISGLIETAREDNVMLFRLEADEVTEVKHLHGGATQVGLPSFCARGRVSCQWAFVGWICDFSLLLPFEVGCLGLSSLGGMPQKRMGVFQDTWVWLKIKDLGSRRC